MATFSGEMPLCPRCSIEAAGLNLVPSQRMSFDGSDEDWVFCSHCDLGFSLEGISKRTGT